LFLSGTAFAIGSNRFVTNFHNFYHILKQDPSANIILQQDAFQLTVNRIHAVSAVYDLMIFETKESIPYHLNLGEIPPQSDEALITLGYPEKVFKKIKKVGKIFNEEPHYIFPVNYFFLSGASGSPVLNFKGQVVGILSAAAGNISIAVKSQKLKDLIEGNVGLNCSNKTNLESCMKEELENLKNSTNRGNAQAQHRLGMFYASEPKKTESDWELIFNLREEAAKQGHALAQFEVGQMYFKGLGVKSDPKTAFQRTKESAEQGFILAQFEVGQMYSKGLGVKPDPDTASQWIEKSAKQGCALAQNEMGKKYYEEWLKLLIENQHYDQKLFNSAFGWFKESVDYPISQYYLAKMLRFKDNKTLNDFRWAFYWMQKAAEQNHAAAQYNLVEMYYNNEVPIINSEYKTEMIFYWSSQSAEQGYAPAQHILALQYINKQRKTDITKKLAFYWMQKAADQNYAPAQYDLGKMYFNKKNETTNEEISDNILWGFHWLNQAAYQGHLEAQYFLGHQYKKHGYTDMGIYWIKEAAKQGHAFAQLDFTKILEKQGKLEEAKFWTEVKTKGLIIVPKYKNEKYKQIIQY